MGTKIRIKSKALRQADFEALVARANTGDVAALKELQEVLDRRPDIWQSVGDLSRHAELAMLGLIACKNTLLMESLERSLKALRKDISPADPSPLEKLLIQRVVLTWMQVQYVDTNYANSHELTLGEKKYVLHLRESSQRNFDTAVKSLLTVRTKLSAMPAPTSHPPTTQTRRSNTHLRVIRAAG